LLELSPFFLNTFKHLSDTLYEMRIMLDIGGELWLIWVRFLSTLQTKRLVVSEAVQAVFLEMVRTLLFLD
jgi:hypothetical protein